jgi:cytochrome c oxidase assembly protein subunit 11
MSTEPSGRLTLNRKMLGKLVVIAFLMFGFGYALVPVYKQMCEVLGINVLTQQDGMVQYDKNTQVDKSRSILIELDGNAQGPWRFRPTTRSVTVHPGELTTVMYEVVNTQNPEPRSAGPGDSELRAAVGHAALHEGRVFLLQAADLEGE